MTTVKVTSVGESMGIVLPKELLDRLQVGSGDTLFVNETPTGVELTARDPNLSEQLDVAGRVMQEDREVLRKLAE